MDFLTFKSFLSIDALIIFNYVGAVLLPFVLWFLTAWLIQKYQLFGEACKLSKDKIWVLLSTKQKVQLLFFFTIVFLFLELFWRMLFEFLIAYMQIRDALVNL